MLSLEKMCFSVRTKGSEVLSSPSSIIHTRCGEQLVREHQLCVCVCGSVKEKISDIVKLFENCEKCPNNLRSLVFDRNNEDYKAPTTSYQEI